LPQAKDIAANPVDLGPQWFADRRRERGDVSIHRIEILVRVSETIIVEHDQAL
jgi:hypothetical protein